MGRCSGITGIARNLNFCRRQGDWWFFCPEHRRQPLYALFAMFGLIASSASIYSCKYGATTQAVNEGTQKILQRQEELHPQTGRPNVFFKWTKFYEPLG